MIYNIGNAVNIKLTPIPVKYAKKFRPIEVNNAPSRLPTRKCKAQHRIMVHNSSWVGDIDGKLLNKERCSFTWLTTRGAKV